MSVVHMVGMIGVGKSTYAKEIGNYFNYDVFYESVEDNPMLEKFYKDPSRWSFSLQVYFFIDRYKKYLEAYRVGNAVLDRSIKEDLLFSKVNMLLGNMTEIEYNCHVDLMKTIVDEHEDLLKGTNDFYVYLKSDFDTILQRILNRSREFEITSDQVDYFKLLHSQYDNWVENEYGNSKLIVLPADRYDITIRKDLEEVLRLISTFKG